MSYSQAEAWRVMEMFREDNMELCCVVVLRGNRNEDSGRKKFNAALI
jgi:hypothetical protein